MRPAGIIELVAGDMGGGFRERAAHRDFDFVGSAACDGETFGAKPGVILAEEGIGSAVVFGPLGKVVDGFGDGLDGVDLRWIELLGSEVVAELAGFSMRALAAKMRKT